MNKRWLSVWVILLTWLFAGFVGYGFAVSSLPVNAQAIPTPVNKPKVTILANTPYTLLLMKDNFTIFYWVDGKEHPAEYKQENLPGGAHYQFGLAMPAWVAVIGRYPDGRWKLSVEPKTNDQAPGSQFAPVIGTTLVEPVESTEPSVTSTVTPTAEATTKPSPTGNPGSSITPSPTATKTPTPAPYGTPTIIYGGICHPNPTPEYPHTITFYGDSHIVQPALTWWCYPPQTPDAVWSVPRATFEAAWDAGGAALIKAARESQQTPEPK